MKPDAIHAAWPGKFVVAGDELVPINPADEVPSAAEIAAAEAAWDAGADARAAAAELAATDDDMARVVEDIWAALKAAQVVTDDDLPPAALAKIAERKAERTKL